MQQCKGLHRSFSPAFKDKLGKAARQALDGVSSALQVLQCNCSPTPKAAAQWALETRIISTNKEKLTMEGSHSLPTESSYMPPLRLSLSPLQVGGNVNHFAVYFYSDLSALVFKSTQQ